MTTTPPKTADPQLQQLVQIAALLDILADRAGRLLEQQQRTNNSLARLERLLEGFTDEGSSFRAHQIDSLTVMYASLLGPILGDRIDSVIQDKGDDYADEMMKGAAVMARNLLRTLDLYRQQREGIDYLENAAGDIQPLA
jgi:hypothetical protein